jgi:hypothetical protein
MESSRLVSVSESWGESELKTLEGTTFSSDEVLLMRGW